MDRIPHISTKSPVSTTETMKLLSFIFAAAKRFLYFVLAILRIVFEFIQYQYTKASEARATSIQHHSSKYRAKVLEKDNIHINRRILSTRRAFTRSGKSLNRIFEETRRKFIEGETDVMLSQHELDQLKWDARDIDRDCDDRACSEMELETLFVDQCRIFRKAEAHFTGAQGSRQHTVNPSYGPRNVLANIVNYIQPDYICGYPNLSSAFDIPLDAVNSLPKDLRVTKANKSKSTVSSRRKSDPTNAEETDDLALPYLTFELKTAYTSQGEIALENQLARALSLLAEREWQLERLSLKDDDICSFPVVGVTGLGKAFKVWAMFRYVDEDDVVHYDMRSLDDYRLSDVSRLLAFHQTMANIRVWAEQERRPHFRECIKSILPLGLRVILYF